MLKTQTHKWYTVVNDLVGGWSITLIDKPMSQHNPSVPGDGEIADFVDEETARYICELHNNALGRGIADTIHIVANTK